MDIPTLEELQDFVCLSLSKEALQLARENHIDEMLPLLYSEFIVLAKKFKSHETDFTYLDQEKMVCYSEMLEGCGFSHLKPLEIKPVPLVSSILLDLGYVRDIQRCYSDPVTNEIIDGIEGKSLFGDTFEIFIRTGKKF